MTETASVLRFEKYTAQGNDYLCIERADLATPLTPVRITELCDRKFGIGGDGVLEVQPFVAGKPFNVRLYNSDGSECECSGNGLRVFAQWLLDHHYATAPWFTIECLAGISVVEVNYDDTLTISMGDAEFDRATIGLTDRTLDPRRYTLPTTAGLLDVTSVSVGTPHTVVFTPLGHATRTRLGPEIAGHEWFAAGTNVQFITDIGAHAVAIEIWERGAGRTLASGSSACAAAAAVISRNLSRSPLTVRMPGGQIQVSLRGTSIWQRATAIHVFDGSIAVPATERVS